MVVQGVDIEKELRSITDPEIPVLSIMDMGIVRKIEQFGDQLEITITPTYTACPAMDVIASAIRLKLIELGFPKVTIKQVLVPAWTTDWITAEGRKKLQEYGIAPPVKSEAPIQCPQCKSYHTEQISLFGSTACKALYKCLDCHEPFDYFKCH